MTILVKVLGVVLSLLSVSMSLAENIEYQEPEQVEITQDICFNVYPILDDICISHEYQLYIYEVSEQYDIDPYLIMAIMERESRGTQYAVNGNCKGLMQIHEPSHRKRMDRLGVTDLYDPYSNILVGVDLISELYNKYGSMPGALMYYHGEKDVAQKLAEGRMSSYASGILNRATEFSKEGN